MTTLQRVQRRDLLPENVKYRDDGCDEGGSSCLNCPLARCVYDDPMYGRHAAHVARNRRIFELRKEGVPVRDLVRAYKVSVRTVHRIIQAGGEIKPSHRQGYEPPIKPLEHLETRQYIKARNPWPVLLENRVAE